MLTIRLQRAGKKNKPEFRIILAEKTAAANKKFQEILGHYNPHTKEFKIKDERVKYWMSQHVTLSPTVHNLFVTNNLVDASKRRAFSIPPKAEEESAVKEEAAPEAKAEQTNDAPVEDNTPSSDETTTEEQNKTDS